MPVPRPSLRTGALALLLCCAASSQAAPALFTDATLQRADALLHQMTAAEKLGQLNQLAMFAPSAKLDAQVAQGQLGSLFFVTDTVQINRLQHLAVDQTRLHIPLLFGYDVIHGYHTIFPVPLALAASWDPVLVQQTQALAAAEARAGGIAWAFSPMVDIARDPRWGRIIEGAGEDPYLGAVLAAAQVRGLQGPALGSPAHVLASVKHFAGYGSAEGGRDYDAAYLSDSQLHNTYLPPFRAAVQAGVGTVMSAYMDLNDIPASGNGWLLHDVLRADWGFHGFVVSDFNAVRDLQTHGYARDQADAAVRALTAGVNMEMAATDTAYQHLQAALDQGRITPAQLDGAVRPILAAKIQLGLFEHPYAEPAALAAMQARRPAYQTAARVAAERSAVLLRNEGRLLPLRAGAHQRIALIGPLADDSDDTLGPWSFGHDTAGAVTLAAGLRAKLGPATQLTVAPGVQIRRDFKLYPKQKTPPAWDASQAGAEFERAVALAAQADVVVLALGEKYDMAGEMASSASLDLPGQQQRLMERIVALGKPVVLLLVSGRPLNLAWANEHVPAILDLWYPGSQGGAAAANLLFGAATPGGKLPLTWPRSVGQIPIYYAHNLTHMPQNQAKRYWNAPSTPLFPFGYGLSYSTFTFSDLRPDQVSVPAGATIGVSATVENSGDATADEVVQLYVHQQSGGASRPVRELKGFERVTLAPHEKRRVQFTLDGAALSYWNPASKGWVNDGARFDVWVGGDADASLHATFETTPAAPLSCHGGIGSD